MKKADIIEALVSVRVAKAQWAVAQTKFNSDVEAVMSRLLHEAAVARMSDAEVANASGFTVKRVRMIMRAIGLNPRDGKNLLSAKAGEALANNAALLGIEPRDMDLMSPLAYLPMGEEMKRALQDKAVSKVVDLEGDPCGAKHPRMTVSSVCLLRGEHDQHRGTCGDEFGSLILWDNK